VLYAGIRFVSYYLPEARLSNETLAALYPGWSAQKIFEKTGVRYRHIAAESETAADLAFLAAQRLFDERSIDRNSVDFLIFCTQEPDYILPSSSCILQDRLGLPMSCGAIDVNQGCSGYVYSLGVAKGLIESGQVRTVLVLTGDTYSKLIHPLDKSVRTLFGDAGSATLLQGRESDAPLIGPFIYGTDGRGADRLIVPTGGFRKSRDDGSSQPREDDSGNVRSGDNLFMDGPDVLTFSLREVPKLYSALLATSKLDVERIDHFVFHQGSFLMLEMLRKKLKLPASKFVIDLEHTGNTVSSTLPVALTRLTGGDATTLSKTVMLVGFGVGYSWAGAMARI
jgi:3-oxoacyl-[acyl-carrier-protein] synthase-3